MPDPADRLKTLPPYIFTTLAQRVQALAVQGHRVIRLDIGSPDGAPPPAVIETLVQEVWKLQETYGNYFVGVAQAWLEGTEKAIRGRDEQMRHMQEDWQRQRRNAELYASQNAQRRTSGIMVGEAPDYGASNGSARG